MWLDLRDVIEVPGASVAFADAAPEPDALLMPSILGFTEPLEAHGRVTNSAGLLELSGTLRANMRCVCDRCGKSFLREKHLEVRVPLAADVEDEGEGDVFPLDGNGIDVTEVFQTCFILDAESKTLCRPDCKGLCPTCGKDLNEGPCGCGKQTDPRFAVLEQLLDKPRE